MSDPLTAHEIMGVSSPHQVGGTRMPRLVARDRPFDQCTNRIRLQLRITNWKKRRGLWVLLVRDWFHTVMRLPYLYILTALIGIWTIIIMFFAALFISEDRRRGPESNCGLAKPPNTIGLFGAFAFSLQTANNGGFALPNGTNSLFEQECHGLQALVYFECIVAMIFRPYFLSYMYSGLAVPKSRAMQVLFGMKAIVTRGHDDSDEGKSDQQSNAASSSKGDQSSSSSPKHAANRLSPWRLLIRIFDHDAQHPVVEANVRVYAVPQATASMHLETSTPIVPQLLRLNSPSDETNSSVLLSLPTTAQHHVDVYSPLYPTSRTNESTGSNDDTKSNPLSLLPFVTNTSGLVLRQADSATCNRDDVVCPICGKTFSTVPGWIKHVQYQQAVEEKKLSQWEDNKSDEMEWCHLRLGSPELLAQEQKERQIPTAEGIREHFAQNISEIVVFVEGIDPMTSKTFLALQSYQFSDLVIHEQARFEPCVAVTDSKSGDASQKQFTVDMDCFHGILMNGDKSQLVTSGHL